VLVPRLVPGWATIDELTISVVLASVAMFGFTQLVVRNRQLLVARDEVAVLAVERERERIARDMHDILGHSLTVISVKAELAGRLLDVDGDRARTEILEVHALARSALADVRGMVSATRAVTLAGELAGARHAFDAAGIEAEVPGALDDVPEALRDVFAWAVREGTTNILRHAAATRARITVAPDALTIDDDGPSGIPDGGATPPAGNGLGGASACASPPCRPTEDPDDHRNPGARARAPAARGRPGARPRRPRGPAGPRARPHRGGAGRAR